MDGDQSKKRKLDVLEEEEEEAEESEESKMEKFYELIRIAKDIRARMMMINGERLNEGEEKMKKKKKKNAIEESKRSSVEAWNPTFQLEDFMEDEHEAILSCPSRMNNYETGPSNPKKENGGGRREGGDNGLDLNLSL